MYERCFLHSLAIPPILQENPFSIVILLSHRCNLRKGETVIYIVTNRQARLRKNSDYGMLKAAEAMDLDKGTSALPTVQATRVLEHSNGCRVSMYFAEKPEENIRDEVAIMPAAAFIRRSEHT